VRASSVLPGLVILLVCRLVEAATPAASRDPARLATDALAAHEHDGMLKIRPPTIVVRNKKLEAYPGSVSQRAELFQAVGLQSKDERARFTCYLRLDVLSTYLRSADPDLAAHWSPYLAEAKRAFDSESFSRTEGCDLHLQMLMWQAATSYAQKRNLTLPHRSLRGAPMVTANFATDPEGGQVSIVEDFKYVKAGENLRDDEWTPVGAAGRDLAMGDYRVRVAWARGERPEVQPPLKIRRSGTFTLYPRSPR